MTPQEKAKELFDKMYMVDDPMGNYPMCFDTAKQCALIAVELALEHCNGKDMNEEFDKVLYLIEVKHEIEKL